MIKIFQIECFGEDDEYTEQYLQDRLRKKYFKVTELKEPVEVTDYDLKEPEKKEGKPDHQLMNEGIGEKKEMNKPTQIQCDKCGTYHNNHARSEKVPEKKKEEKLIIIQKCYDYWKDNNRNSLQANQEMWEAISEVCE